MVDVCLFDSPSLYLRCFQDFELIRPPPTLYFFVLQAFFTINLLILAGLNFLAIVVDMHTSIRSTPLVCSSIRSSMREEHHSEVLPRAHNNFCMNRQWPHVHGNSKDIVQRNWSSRWHFSEIGIPDKPSAYVLQQ